MIAFMIMIKKGNVNDLSKDLYLDSDLVLHAVKAFTEHIKAPKEGWVKYEPQPEPEKEVKATLASLEPINEIPFPNTVQKHILEYEQVKEAHRSKGGRRKCTGGQGNSGRNKR